jgi:hypothetical protein
MDEVQKSTDFENQKEIQVSPCLSRLILIGCTVSFALYLIFSRGLRYLLGNQSYHTQLFNTAFPKGLMEGLSQHAPSFPYFPTLYNGFILIGFLTACIVSAWLMHSLLHGNRSELGPHLVLFSFATAIVPTLLMALIFWPDGKGMLSLKMGFLASLLITVILTCLKFTLFRDTKQPSEETEDEVHEKIGWAWVFILPLIVMFIVAYYYGTMSWSYGSYDALFYHLPLAASWFHNGSITRGFDVQFYSPGNTELMMRWGLLLDSERFVFLVLFFAAIFCIYMVYKLARAIGQGRQTAFVAACCAASFPVLPFQATTAYTDTMGALFLLLSVFFIIRWIQKNLLSNRSLFCAGLAAGLAVGAKVSMVSPLFAMILVTTIIVLRSKHIWLATGTRPIDIGLNWAWLFKFAGIFSFAVFLGGGYWYLRNIIEMHNPFYPISILGLPGLTIDQMLPQYPLFIESPWKQIFYPWTELIYVYPYDDGIGAVATGIVLPVLLLWPYLHYRTQDVKRVGPGVIYSIVCISLILFVSSSQMIIRFGLFAILTSFIFVGEIWRKIPFAYLKIITLAAFLVMTTAITYNLEGGYLYSYLHKNETRSERLHVPEVVNSLPPSRIFNAGGSYHTLGLMGRDYRHVVVTLYRESTPEDVITFKAAYVLLNKDTEALYRSKLQLEYVGSESKGSNPVSLWKVVQRSQGPS